VDKVSPAASPPSETPVPTDLLASLLMERASAPSQATWERFTLPLKVYGVMAVTTLLTFAALTTGYQTLFSRQLFA
jgi:hypothetical protein